ncbi:unnamed protein product, partial [Closterium sp. Naga37s-1]
LRASRGMKAPARILLSGSSAGGQAVVTLCDLLPLLFPRALVKCIMDAGLFVDAEDRTKRRAFAGMVKATVALHNMRVNWRCSQTMSPANQWQCFFPHQALRFVSSPVLAVNSLFDYPPGGCFYPANPLTAPTSFQLPSYSHVPRQPVAAAASIPPTHSLLPPPSNSLRAAMSPVNQWRCFFPHQALRFVSSPVLAVNSLFDYPPGGCFYPANPLTAPTSSQLPSCSHVASQPVALLLPAPSAAASIPPTHSLLPPPPNSLRAAMSPVNQWRCFFPHQALRFVSSPVLAVNSLFDYRALMLGNQLPANQAQATACLRQIAKEGGTDLLRLVTSQSWRHDPSALAEIQSGGTLFPGGDYKGGSLEIGLTSTVEEGDSPGNGKGGKRKGKGGGGGAGKGRRVRGSAGAAAAEAPVCAPEEHKAVLNVAWQMIQYTDAASLELGPTGDVMKGRKKDGFREGTDSGRLVARKYDERGGATMGGEARRWAGRRDDGRGGAMMGGEARRGEARGDHNEGTGRDKGRRDDGGTDEGRRRVCVHASGNSE